MKVKLKKFEYILDWYEITEVEVDTEKFAFFVLQYRCGIWYLMHYANIEGKLKNVYEHDFQLYDPCDAVKKLGDKIKRYESSHECSITKPLSILKARLQKHNSLFSYTKTICT